SSFAFRSVQQRRHPEVATACAMGVQFRGSIPRLHLPLSTLHLRRYRRKYMTRSQCGSLLLHCMKLSFTTPCRLLPAHLNGLNCLNEQHSLPSGWEVWIRVLVSLDSRA